MEQFCPWGVLSGRGWSMYCDRCGTQLNAGTQFCVKCGKAIVGGAEAVPEGQGTGQVSGNTGAYGAVADGRVRRNLRTLATLWTINGILRLVEVCGMMIFGTVFFPFMRGWGRGMVWPFGGRWGMDIPFLGGLFSVGILLGLVIGFLALLRFPLGTALGIYTLWVLLPEESGREYDRLAQGDVRMNSEAVSP